MSMEAKSQHSIHCHGLLVLPDGRPCPLLLTEEETIALLRLNIDGPNRPTKTLAYYRGKGLLKATRVGRRLRYRIEDLRGFLAELAELQNA